ncbi:hypothetical protein D3C73_1110620 [compost metagenome]
MLPLPPYKHLPSPHQKSDLLTEPRFAFEYGIHTPVLSFQIAQSIFLLKAKEFLCLPHPPNEEKLVELGNISIGDRALQLVLTPLQHLDPEK